MQLPWRLVNAALLCLIVKSDPSYLITLLLNCRLQVSRLLVSLCYNTQSTQLVHSRRRLLAISPILCVTLLIVTQ